MSCFFPGIGTGEVREQCVRTCNEKNRPTMLPYDATFTRDEVSSDTIPNPGCAHQSGVCLDDHSTDVDVTKRQIPAQRQEVRGRMTSTPDAYSDTRVHFRRRLLEGCHIVLLEDDNEALEVLGQILETLGAKTERYSNPVELLTTSKLDADILISDVGLPQMTGLELIRHLRSQGYARPAVALTAYDGRRDRLASLRAGFNVHLTKPVDRELLVATVAALLGRFEDQ